MIPATVLTRIPEMRMVGSSAVKWLYRYLGLYRYTHISSHIVSMRVQPQAYSSEQVSYP